jgi:hypothetical protein
MPHWRNIESLNTKEMEINMELENIVNVFGANSPEAEEAATTSSKATADFVGIAIHCAAGNSVCNTPNAKSDVLP